MLSYRVDRGSSQSVGSSVVSPQRQAAGLCGACDIEGGSCFAELGVFSALHGLARRGFPGSSL